MSTDSYSYSSSSVSSFHLPFSLTFTILLVAAATLFLTRFLGDVSHDAREPPLVKVRFPVLGHMIGHSVNLLRYGKKYAFLLNKKYNLPIYTMNALNHRFYIVNSSQLAAQVHRHTKQLSFTPFLAIVAKHISEFTEDEMVKIEKNMFRKEGKEGMVPEMHDMIIKEMSPAAQNLRDMSAVVLEMMSETVNKVKRQEEEEKEESSGQGDEMKNKSVEFYKWIRQSFTMASMTAFYGPQHPFSNKPHLEERFWVFEKALNFFIINLAPRITASQAFQAREELKEALVDYFKREGDKEASNMIKERYRIHRQHGLSLDGCARAEVPMLQGVLANATTTTFWFLAHAYSMPSLLADLRAELAGIVEIEESEESSDDGDGDQENEKREENRKTVTINRFSVEAIKKNCPLMLGTYREVLRLLGGLPSTRVVLEDTTFGAQQYLLKAGSTVQIATNVLHTDESTWGADVVIFNPYRFLTAEQAANIQKFSSSSSSSNSNNIKTDSNSNRHVKASHDMNPSSITTNPTRSTSSSSSSSGPIYSFGGGSALCPGRHFAQIEVLGFAAAMLWALDITSATDGVSPPDCPPENATDMPTSFSKPVKNVDVLIKVRREKEEGRRVRVKVVP